MVTCRGATVWLCPADTQTSTFFIPIGNLVNKTLIATAFALVFSGHAAAQSSASNVVLYGLVDMGYGYSKVDGSSAVNALDSGTQSGSRWGLRGSEDLGNGLKANFQLESGFSGDTGQSGQSGRLFGRASWAGLSGSFGEVRLGRQGTLGYSWFGAVSPFGTDFKNASINNTFGYGNVADRVDNGAFYFTPSFGGFKAAIGYSFNSSGQETDVNDTPVVSLGAQYKNGPFLAVVTYEQRNVADSNDVAGTDDIQNIQLGAVYDFGPVAVHAGYGRLDNRGFDAGASKENAYLVGLSAPLGNGELFGTYQRVDDRNKNEFGLDEARSGVAVGYTYNMSKRTNLYVYASQYKNIDTRADDESRLADARQFGVGLRHRF